MGKWSDPRGRQRGAVPRIEVREKDIRPGELAARWGSGMPGRCSGDDEPGLVRRVSDDFGVVTRPSLTTLTPGDTTLCDWWGRWGRWRGVPWETTADVLRKSSSCARGLVAFGRLGTAAERSAPQEPAPQPGRRGRVEQAGPHLDQHQRAFLGRGPA